MTDEETESQASSSVPVPAAGLQTHTLNHPPGQLQQFSEDLIKQNVVNSQCNGQQNILKELFLLLTDM